MGGKVLELESERLRAEGEARGKAIGESIGEARGKAIGESIGKAIGEVRGEERLSVLINKLILDKRNDEIQIVVTDAKKRRHMMSMDFRTEVWKIIPLICIFRIVEIL